MSLFFDSTRRPSDKNGMITVEWRFGRPQLMVEGYSQTGDGMTAIWHDALMRAMPLVPPQGARALLLGLGGGGMVKDVYALFPGARITAIEHDPVMIDLARELKLYEPYLEPAILCDDAGEGLKKLSGQFDLIAIDIFRGGEASPHLYNDAFYESLRSVLAPEGVVLVNVAGQRELLREPAKHFAHADLWKCRANWLGMFGE